MAFNGHNSAFNRGHNSNANIRSGTIDGAVIGGTDPKAGEFTTLGVGGTPAVGGDIEVIGATNSIMEVRTTTGGRRLAVWASDSSGNFIGTRSNDTFGFITNNAERANFSTDGHLTWSGNAAAPAIQNEAASATNPTLIPRKDDATSGIGAGATGEVVVVAGGAEKLTIDSNTGATGGTGSAGAGSQYVELQIGASRYKLLHDGTI